MFITIKLDDMTVRVYGTQEEATTKSITLNRKDPEHPSFRLYCGNAYHKGNEATYMGELHRDFGDDKLYWRK